MSHMEKRDLIEEIINNLSEWTKIREISNKFEEETNETLSVTPQYVHNVVKDLEEEGEVELKQEELGGNKVNFVRPTDLSNPHRS